MNDDSCERGRDRVGDDQQRPRLACHDCRGSGGDERDAGDGDEERRGGGRGDGRADGGSHAPVPCCGFDDAESGEEE